MVLLSFYLISRKRGRFRRFWFRSIDHYPTDWLELKTLVLEVMRKVYVEHHVTSATISLERHLPGRSMSRFSGYVRKKIPILRQYEAVLRVELEPSLNKLKIKGASFNVSLFHVRGDFWEMERGIKWRSPPLIPREHRNLLAAKSFLSEPSVLRFANYNREPKSSYGMNLQRLVWDPLEYAQPPNLEYQPKEEKRLRYVRGPVY